MHHWLQNCSGGICRIRWTAVTFEDRSQMIDHLWAQENVGAVSSQTVAPFLCRRKSRCDFSRNRRASWRGFEGDKRASTPESTIGAENQGLITPISGGASILFLARAFRCRRSANLFLFGEFAIFADQPCPVVALWNFRSVQWQQIGVARWWCIEVPDLLSGGALKFRICSVVADRTCPVVAH